MNRLITTNLFIVSIFVLTLTQSCTEEPVVDQDTGIEFLELTVKNDSQIVMNGPTFPLSELDIHLEKTLRKSSTARTASIKAHPSVKMMTIKKIERTLAADSIGKILYLHQSDTIEMKLKLTPNNLIILTVNSFGKLTHEEKEVTDDWLNTDFKKLITSNENPLVEVRNQSGTSYYEFSEQKDRIEEILDEIDPTVELKEGRQDFYKRIK